MSKLCISLGHNRSFRWFYKHLRHGNSTTLEQERFVRPMALSPLRLCSASLPRPLGRETLLGILAETPRSWDSARHLKWWDSPWAILSLSMQLVSDKSCCTVISYSNTWTLRRCGGRVGDCHSWGEVEFIQCVDGGHPYCTHCRLTSAFLRFVDEAAEVHFHWSSSLTVFIVMYALTHLWLAMRVNVEFC